MNEEAPVYLTGEIVAGTNLAYATIIDYIKRYTTVDGLTMGMKVGGRWKVYPGRLRRFLNEGGLPRIR